ncbi:hypothetical protein HWV00_04415 [Moritella sp. 24]|uniref:hypothetical protein n=1 Tax=Moritella sp. 24 TaxID=2746230 RepID=UPI001BABBF11|nr:hypothetical protein [Moritella sp. 24]QUM75538.1 hypothetical protein HWV00_04415 [Moritella sp. 24]
MTKIEEIRLKIRNKKEADFNKLTFTFSNEDIELAHELAKIDFSYYENKNSSQVKSSVESSMVGILGEVAVYHELSSLKEFTDMSWLAGKERASILDGQLVYQKSDLECKQNGEEKSIEVKTIKFGDPEGQILVGHAHKYKNNGADFVVFVHVMELDDSWKANIYNIVDLDDIISSKITTNCFGVPCYTVPPKQ